MKTIVHIKDNDQQHNDYSKGDKGYIDGYVRGGNDTPLAVVVVKGRIVMIPLHSLEAKGILKSEP